MKFSVSPFVRLALAFVFSLAVCTGAFAADSHDRTQFGHDITIGPNDEASEVTCFGCSVRVRGHVTGDVTTFGGSVVLEDQAEIGGDVTTFAGGVRLDREASVHGDVSVFGGNIRRAPEASIGGDVTNFSSPGWLILMFVLPLMLLGGFIALIVWLIVRLVRRPTIPAAARV